MATSQSASQTQRPTSAAERPVSTTGRRRTSWRPRLNGCPALRGLRSVSDYRRAASSHERAERLLQEALVDLHAGRDEMARARIEGALGVIHSGTSSSVPIFQAANPAAAKPSVGVSSAASPADLPQPRMPRAGFPSYVPDPTLDAHDVALKPLHDPYLGDEPTTTQKSTAGENSLRETLPSYAPLNSSLSLNRPLPRMTGELPQYLPSVDFAYAPSGVSQTQAVAAGQNQPARVRWPESDAAPASPKRRLPQPRSRARRPSI